MSASETPQRWSDRAGGARIKGAAFREFLRFYVKTYGEAALRERSARMPAALRASLALEEPVLGVIQSTWYPAPLVHALLDELTRDMGNAEIRSLASKASAAVMQTTLRGLYKVLFDWMATPERYARHAPKLWHSYYDSGTMEITVQASGTEALTVIRDWAAHHPFICELNRGAAEAIYGAMGCSDVVCERVACVSRGDAECRFVTRWNV